MFSWNDKTINDFAEDDKTLCQNIPIFKLLFSLQAQYLLRKVLEC